MEHAHCPTACFSPKLPLQIKIGYWLTDLPHEKMGNLVVLPGSHRQQYMDGYDTHDSVPGEMIVCPRKGTMTVMHSSIWHRVEPNESDVVRYNIFVAYCPSWITSADRFHSSPEWLKTLNREQRIIMRSYSHAYHNANHPHLNFHSFSTVKPVQTWILVRIWITSNYIDENDRQCPNGLPLSNRQ